MKFPKIVTIFKVKVNYKSGISEVFECRKFSIEGRKISWVCANNLYRPLDIAFNSSEDIESVWQVGHRKAIVLA